MEEVEDIFLDTVTMKVEDPEDRSKDVEVAKSSEATSEERKVAEERIWLDIKRTGELIVHGDIGVVEGIEGSKRIRDQCNTKRERLDYVKMAKTGILHILMNQTIQNMQQKLLVSNSTQDLLSLANLRTACSGNLDFLTNVENDIKVTVRKILLTDWLSQHVRILVQIQKMAMSCTCHVSHVMSKVPLVMCPMSDVTPTATVRPSMHSVSRLVCQKT